MVHTTRGATLPLRIVLYAIFTLFPFLASAQVNLWHVLAEVKMNKSTDANGYEMEKPVFNDHIRFYEKKQVKIKGYIIPLSEIGAQQKFMLSSLPFNVCYFCGGAGPETVIEIETSKKIDFTTKQVVMEGTLVLNDSDPDHHMYILKNAQLSN
ncbi:hypothetical protein [Chryseosolibacter indicus]|uniref:DUF3299 domain-containing protein n=1 Tax=Chryseosolibacter indicus TaxID=2782351 RepID=A0ABS5VTB6_9BACT|nr:hypothetical protein [Chryseosolibacter indicus]MBT1704288.1 hypothetical protein [Chryseosolibacter indicus]